MSGCASLDTFGDRINRNANVTPAPTVPAVIGDSPIDVATPTAPKPTPAILANSPVMKPRSDVTDLRILDSDNVLSIKENGVKSSKVN